MGGDEWLSQLGNSEGFREAPRFPSEVEVSTTAGRLDVAQAVRAVFGRPPRRADRVRYFECGRLQAANYWCLATASRRNPNHASVRAPIAERSVAAHEAWWNNPKRDMLGVLAKEVSGNEEDL